MPAAPSPSVGPGRVKPDGVLSPGRRFSAGLVSGMVAATVNIAALAMADAISLPTAHGGLLRLLGTVVPLRLATGGVTPLTFHAIVALGMAQFYAFGLEPFWRGRPMSLGLAYAAVVWLANAAIVLPLTCEGFAGHRDLSLGGMAWFAVAHTLFFVVLALTFARMRGPGHAWRTLSPSRS